VAQAWSPGADASGATGGSAGSLPSSHGVVIDRLATALRLKSTEVDALRQELVATQRARGAWRLRWMVVGSTHSRPVVWTAEDLAEEVLRASTQADLLYGPSGGACGRERGRRD
jgi:hypothetical protein